MILLAQLATRRKSGTFQTHLRTVLRSLNITVIRAGRSSVLVLDRSLKVSSKPRATAGPGLSARKS
jgi:hypothetical protein